MSIHISKNRIRATGADANGLFIAMAPDDQLLEWERAKIGSEDFQRMVKEAIQARNITTEAAAETAALQNHKDGEQR
jgi:hypothetical protein